MSDIKIELVSKAIKDERFVDVDTFNEFRTKTIQTLRSHNLRISDNDDLSVKCTIPIGNQSIITVIDFVSDVSDDDSDELLFESMEIRIQNTCTLKNFSDCASELYSALNELRDIVQELNLELKKEFCVICEIKTMPNIKMMLNALNYNAIHCETPDGQNFELQENKILYYDKNIHRDMSTFIKKIIVTYS